MSYMETRSMLYLQDLPLPVVPRSGNGADHVLANHIKSGFFQTDKLCAPYYFAPAKSERATVIGCSGLNSNYLLKPQDIKRMNDAGISVIWMVLPRAKRGEPIVERYKELFEAFVTHSNSPAFMLTSHAAPKILATHSTGGYLLLNLLQDQNKGRTLAHIFSSAVYIAPFTDCANASRMDRPLQQKIFRDYMGKDPDKLPTERRISGAYIKMSEIFELAREGGNKAVSDGSAPSKASGKVRQLFNNSRQINSDYVASTCGHILELQDHAWVLQDTFDARAAARLPSIFVIPEKDTYACPKVSARIATQIGADIIEVKGAGHDPIRTHPEVLDSLIGRLDACIEKYNAREQPVYIPVPLRMEQEPLPPYRMPLRDRLGLTLQRSTGFLNTTASFF